ncbi:uncharacterized protein LTR77_011095 [Saxophila tyrrhenica]|uniref:Uncharacterized protein n=1 Tax=Saxophila tyrrhenica TaxID=1690608 RepID=A0AAV9NU67_9PEZI|nr:hypothetical protein LTR77_011095 [Saxophila tyrrhenica]
MDEVGKQMQRLDLTHTFTVRVGDQRTLYTLHRALAEQTSDYWTRNQAEFDLHGIPKAVFDVFFQWHLTGMNVIVLRSDEIPGLDNRRIRPRSSPNHRELMGIYSVALTLEDKAFQNAVMDRMIKTIMITREAPGQEVLVQVFTEKPNRCPMQRLVVRCWRKYLDEHKVDEQWDDWRDEFKKALAMEQNGTPDDAARWPSLRRRCEYHVHDERASRGR